MTPTTNATVEKLIADFRRFPGGKGDLIAATLRALLTERDAAVALFHECAVARDEAGYVDTVPGTIKHLNTNNAELRSLVASLRAQLAAVTQERDELGRSVLKEVGTIGRQLGLEQATNAALRTENERLKGELAQLRGDYHQ